METRTRSAKQLEVPGVITFEQGAGGLPRVKVKTAASTAEIYLQGAQVTGFQKNVEPPLLFLSRLSQFAADKPIRGGVPICLPWFGPRAGDVMHGFARITEWEVIETAALPEGGATLRFRLPDTAARAAWPAFSADYFVTVTDRLGMELVVTNRSDRPFEFENCLHSYFAVGDIRDVSITGLKSVQYLDKTENGARKLESADAIRITLETNRVFLDTGNAVEIHDARFRRKIRVEKSGSASTVVWNPWTTQKMADFGEDEYQQMVCVESGNVGQSKVTLAPGKTARLKVVLSSDTGGSCGEKL